MAYKILQSPAEMVRGVIFDMDGVILDTEKLYARFWQEAAVALGYPMTREQALGMRSLNRQAGQAQLERYFGAGVSHAQLRQKRIALMDRYIAAHGVAPMPGAAQALSFLHGHGVAVGLATSSPMERVERYLRPAGLWEQFDVLCSGYDVPNGKPAPDIYRKAADMLGLAPSQCLAVEDSPAGILSAYRAGCLPVFIPDQDEAGEDTLSMLFAHADTLGDLVALLERESVL